VHSCSFIQDEDRAKAEGPSSEELKRLDRLKAELLSANSSQTSGSPVGSISSNSIGRTNGGTRKKGLSPRGSKERRRSAGDEQGMMSQLNMFVRTRTDSGKQLSDLVRSLFHSTLTCLSYHLYFTTFMLILWQHKFSHFFDIVHSDDLAFAILLT